LKPLTSHLRDIVNLEKLRTSEVTGVLFSLLLWLRNTKRIKRLVGEARARPRTARPDARRILVPVMVWNDSDVPWFSVACGLLLAEAGHHVTFVIDDLPFGDSPRRQSFILTCIRVVMRGLGDAYAVVPLSSVAPGPSRSENAERTRELAALNALRDLRGEMVTEGRAEKTVLFEGQIGRAWAVIEAFLATHPADAVVVPGGIHASSGAWSAAARQAGIRVATFDGGSNGTALWAMDGIACHFADVPRMFERLEREADQDELDFVMATAETEIRARRAGLDKFGAQIRNTANRAGPDEDFVVIALNVPWDTQALDRHVAFESICQFIVETVRHVITTSDIHVVVRQHPAERMKMTRSNDDYRRLLAEAFGAHPQVHFVAPEDPVNTYSLIERALATLVHTSTIGTEAVLFGKPALTGADPYYSHLGIVHAARSLDEYRALLNEILRGELPVTVGERRNAQICYYLSQCNSWLVTPFNTGGFAQWSQMSFAAIAEAPQQRLLVDSISSDIPICWQNHLLRLADQADAKATAA
jgi:hypothetical protein